MIVSVSGLIGSGKDTIADYLEKEHGFTRMSFAASVKDAVAAIFSWDREMLEGKTKEARAEREKVDHWWAERFGIPHLTPRWVLQYFGTDVCRNHFHNDIWLASLENKLLKLKGNVVISDARFRNELDLIKTVGGHCMYVERGELPEWYNYAVQYNAAADDAKTRMRLIASIDKNPNVFNRKIHPSEWEWIGFPFDTSIDNDGTIDDLYQNVEKGLCLTILSEVRD